MQSEWCLLERLNMNYNGIKIKYREHIQKIQSKLALKTIDELKEMFELLITNKREGSDLLFHCVFNELEKRIPEKENDE